MDIALAAMLLLGIALACIIQVDIALEAMVLLGMALGWDLSSLQENHLNGSWTWIGMIMGCQQPKFGDQDLQENLKFDFQGENLFLLKLRRKRQIN